MKLGLLQCDLVKPEFLSIDGDLTDMVRRLLVEGGADVEVVTYRVYENELPAATDECDAWLSGGSRASVFNNEEWISLRMYFLNQ